MRLKPWHVFVLLLVSLGVNIYALRANNLHMVQLRDQVYQADKQNGDVEAALQRLRSYVLAHMNTQLASGPNAVRPPIQLTYTYDRLTAAQQAGAGLDNSNIYPEAQKYCEKAIPDGVSGRYRLACVQTYISQRDTSAPPPIPKNLYQFDFVSPLWSPDLAGWSLAVSGGLALIWIGALLYRHLLRHVLRAAGRRPAARRA